jgi:hypothetical protein
VDLVGIALYPLQAIEIGRRVFHESWRNEEWEGPKVFTSEDPFVAERGSVTKDCENGTRVPGVTKISANGRKSLLDDRIACNNRNPPRPSNERVLRGHRPSVSRLIDPYVAEWGVTAFVDTRDETRGRRRSTSRRPSGCTTPPWPMIMRAAADGSWNKRLWSLAVDHQGLSRSVVVAMAATITETITAFGWMPLSAGHACVAEHGRDACQINYAERPDFIRDHPYNVERLA